jgi:hypothetical protein
MLPIAFQGTSKLRRFLMKTAILQRTEPAGLRLSTFAPFLSLFIILTAATVFGETPNPDLTQLFPERVGSYRRVGAPQPGEPNGVVNPLDSSSVIAGMGQYSGGNTKGFLVQISRFHQDADAYSALTIYAAMARARNPKIELTSAYGTGSFVDGNEVMFFKGLDLVRISGAIRKDGSADFQEFAHQLSDTIDKGEGEIPALVKHLPNLEVAQKRALFLNRFLNLQLLAPNQSVLGVLQTDGDADAAFVDYGSGKVLIVEYHTPQLAKENDERLIAKIKELWKLGEPAPTGYRRVGNYSVFVFDAANDAAAKQMIDQVKYEQVVQWLGQNPYLFKEAEKRYVETTLGVFVAVVKASGYALIGCLGLGGLIGALLFTKRRAQQRSQEAFSDAGGMLRLNIDELTPQTDPARLLGPGQ